MTPDAMFNYLKTFSPLGATVFSAVFLGGIALSFFWKNFGPWMQLKEAQEMVVQCRVELEQCRRDSAENDRQHATLRAEYADMSARYSLVMEALTRSGIAMVMSKPPGS